MKKIIFLLAVGSGVLIGGIATKLIFDIEEAARNTYYELQAEKNNKTEIDKLELQLEEDKEQISDFFAREAKLHSEDKIELIDQIIDIFSYRRARE